MRSLSFPGRREDCKVGIYEETEAHLEIAEALVPPCPMVNPKTALSLGRLVPIPLHFLYSWWTEKQVFYVNPQLSVSINGHMASVPVENLKPPKKSDFGAKVLLCCLLLFFLLAQGKCLPKKQNSV